MDSSPKPLERRVFAASDETQRFVRFVPPSKNSDAVPQVDLLRFFTAGSVDDGKSTLVGRLLYDTRSILEDQFQSIETASRRRGEDRVNLALLTDGLRSEREQNITIDVAYRYFATSRRRFIVADTPGHEQYTRNMVTGASTAELALVLLDAHKGIVTQSRRHSFVAALLRIPHIVIAVNKMDLVDYGEEAFERICRDYRAFTRKLDITSLFFVPISALHGDNVVERSGVMPWYSGPTLLQYLETVNVDVGRNLVDFRFPVQNTLCHDNGHRAVAGRIVSGGIASGQEVLVLPSRIRTCVKTISSAGASVSEAIAGDSIALTVEDPLDVGRGDMLVRPMNLPHCSTRLDAVICWFGAKPLDLTATYEIRHTTRTVRASITRLVHKIDVDTLHRERTPTLGLNDIGRVAITTAQPLFFDSYQVNRGTGCFVLTSPLTHDTVAAGFIRGPIRAADEFFSGVQHTPPAGSSEVACAIPREAHAVRNGHKAAVLWFTGLSGAGKSTLARTLERRLFERGCRVAVLDGDLFRQGVSADLAFSAGDRAENIRRAGEVARLFFENGDIVLCAFISPYASDRARVRGLFPSAHFLEVFVDCPLDECARRDPKGLYARTRTGQLSRMTGVADPYEIPVAPDFVARTAVETREGIVDALIDRLRALNLLSD